MHEICMLPKTSREQYFDVIDKHHVKIVYTDRHEENIPEDLIKKDTDLEEMVEDAVKSVRGCCSCKVSCNCASCKDSCKEFFSCKNPCKGSCKNSC